MKRTGRTAANDLLSQEKDLNHLTTALSTLCKTHTAAMQWILSYSKVVGNEILGRLAKEESTKRASVQEHSLQGSEDSHQDL